MKHYIRLTIKSIPISHGTLFTSEGQAGEALEPSGKAVLLQLSANSGHKNLQRFFVCNGVS
jgi:hypothetical protein